MHEEVALIFLRRLVILTHSQNRELITDYGFTGNQARLISNLKPSGVNRLIQLVKCITIKIDSALLVEAITSPAYEREQSPPNDHLEVSATILKHLSLIIEQSSTPGQLQITGVNDEAKHAVSKITLLEISQVVNTGIIFYQIEALTDNIDATLAFIAQEEEQEALFNKLVQANASFSMMNAITGIKKAQFRNYRLKYNFPTTQGGMPAKLSESEEMQARKAWLNSKSLQVEARCLAVYNAMSNVSLRDIWTSMSEWYEQDYSR